MRAASDVRSESQGPEEAAWIFGEAEESDGEDDY